MSRNRSFQTLIIALAVMLTATSVSFAQFGGRGGRGARSWMGGSRLLKLEIVQKELELSEEQIEELNDIGKKPAPKKGEEAEAPKERPNFREMSEEQRTAYFAKRREESTNRQSAEQEAVEEILLPHQARRLEQITIQLMGAQALSDEKVMKEVGIDDETKEKMQEIARERMTEMRDVMRDVFQTGDREEIQATMGEMRESIETAVYEAMTPEQNAKFKELKGPPIPFTPESLMGELMRNRFGGDRGGDRGSRVRGGGRGARGAGRGARGGDKEDSADKADDE